MGQAKRRGIFEERKAQAIVKHKERQRADREAFLLKLAELDAILDRDYLAPEKTGRLIGVVGTGGFGLGNRRGKSIAMATMLGVIARMDNEYKRK